MDCVSMEQKVSNAQQGDAVAGSDTTMQEYGQMLAKTK